MGRFSPRGQEKVYWVTTIASQAAPTVAELTAGHDVTGAVKALSGFSFGANDIDVADMGSLFPKTIPGMETMAASSITLHQGDDPADADEVIGAYFTQGVAGYVVFIPKGAITATKKCQVWPVQVKSNTPDKSADAVGSTRTVQFSNTGAPTIPATIAA